MELTLLVESMDSFDNNEKNLNKKEKFFSVVLQNKSLCVCGVTSGSVTTVHKVLYWNANSIQPSQ